MKNNEVYKEKIPVANTFIGEQEARAAYRTVKGGWLSMGKEVAAFEEKFAKFTGSKYAIAVNNGTSALHVALIALGVGNKDEVVLPSLTFISTANAVLYQNAKPVLAESDPMTFNITADMIEKKITKKTKAVIAVDMNGMPFDYDSVMGLLKKRKIALIADSAESLGAEYKGKKIGAIAPLHCFSFFPNKNITTGEGGMITTDSKYLAKKMKIIRHQGQDRRYHHIILGYNYRMTEVQAAIGSAQLDRLNFTLSIKEKMAKRYNELLSNLKNIEVPYVPEYVTRHAWYMYAIKVKGLDRDRIVRELEKRNIETRLSFPPIHIQPYYQKRFGYKNNSLPITYASWKKLIDIPIWVGMIEDKQRFVSETIKKLCDRSK